MANRYAVGTGNWSDTSTWSTTSGGATGASVPTAADDVFLDANTTALTINSGAIRVCRSINCTGFTGTLTHNASTTLQIGDATAGASNVALKFVAGMTYTASSVNTSRIEFESTSGTQQTIDFAGKTTGPLVWQGSGGNWILNGDVTMGSTNTVSAHNTGTLDFGSQTITITYAFTSNSGSTRTLSLGSSSITVSGDGFTVWNASSSGLTISANTATITLDGTGVSFGGGSQDWNGASIVMSGSGTATQSGTNTFANFTRTGSAAKTDVLNVSNSFTCTGTFTCNGNSATNRVLVQSAVTGSSRTITAATVSVTNADFQDITGAGAGSWNLSAITGNSGDCGGNSGITFTTPTTQTCTMSSNKNWDDVTIWTSRVPLPQDNISGANITGGQLNTNGMPRLGKDIDWTGATGGFAWGFNIVNPSIFGSITLVSGMTAIGGSTITLEGRGSHTITSAGVSISPPTQISSIGGSYTLQDALSIGGNFTFNQGTFDANDFDVTCLTFSSSNSNTRTLTMGSGTWSLTSTSISTIWNIGTSTNLTFSGASSTIDISSASANTRSLALGGLTYGTIKHTVADSTGIVGLATSTDVTIGTIYLSNATSTKTLRFQNNRTFIVDNFNVNGVSGNLISVVSDSGGNAFTLSKSSGIVSCDYLSIQDSTATGGATWYAGANSTSVSGNSGWIFTAPPATDINYTDKSEQQIINELLSNSPHTAKSVQEALNVYYGYAPQQYSVQEILSIKTGTKPQTAKSIQEFIFDNIKDNLGLSGSYTNYSTQKLLRLAQASSLSVDQIMGVS